MWRIIAPAYFLRPRFKIIFQVIASGIAETPDQVEKYASCTLLSSSMTHESFAQELTQESKKNSITSCVQFLVENEFIRFVYLLLYLARFWIQLLYFCWFRCIALFYIRLKDTVEPDKIDQAQTVCKRYVPTQLGLGCLASSLSPDEALIVFSELQKARKCFVLENELHIIYQVSNHWINDISMINIKL